MSALTKLFPNATARPWHQDSFYWILGPRGQKDAVTRADGAGPDMGLADAVLTMHAVNTYDARDEALREALRFARSVRAAAIAEGFGGDKESEYAIAKIESALAVKP